MRARFLLLFTNWRSRLKPDAGCDQLDNTNACDDDSPRTLSDPASNAACMGPEAKPCDESNVYAANG